MITAYVQIMKKCEKIPRCLVGLPLLFLHRVYYSFHLQFLRENKQRVIQLQKRLGITTIYVTHDQGEALALSDQIAVMDKGKIIQVGSPWEIYYKPLNTFVADFVGTANLLEGTVTEKYEEHLVINVGETKFRVEESNVIADIGDAIVMCIRPEGIDILEKASNDKTNVLKGNIRNYIFEGAHVRYWVETESLSVVVDAFDPSEKGIYQNDILLHFHPSKIHLLFG